MKNWMQSLKDYGNRDLAEKKAWYGAVADTYHQVRPRYPQEIINRVVELTQIQPPAQILELGTGPGIATLPFAQLDFFLLGLEPNPEAADLAQKICVEYPRVTIQNTTFEEWEIEPERFEAILAATSWHWIASEISYPKAHIALKDQGWLILLWNTPPQISDEIYRQLDEIYQRLTPSIPAYARFETIGSQAEHFRQFGQDIIKSGSFEYIISLYCSRIRKENNFI
jgi:SAM-dependent methyltransferase